MAFIFDDNLNYICTDQELTLYDKYVARTKTPIKLKVWLTLHKDGLI